MSNLNEEDIAKYLEECEVAAKEYVTKPSVVKAYPTDFGEYIVIDENNKKYSVSEKVFLETYEEVSKEKTIEEYFAEWEKHLTDISIKSAQLYLLKEKIFDKEQDIINNTDFKELYGKNNADVRKNHLKQEMQADYDAKNDLEMDIDYAKRRIDYIRALMRMQGSLIDAGVIE